MLIMGEVHTALLMHSHALNAERVHAALDVVPGARPRVSERPNRYAVSAERYAGVDCGLATPQRARVRVIGTVAHRSAVTGGRVVQGSAYTAVTAPAEQRRWPWSHYLADPGVVELIGKATPEQLVAGFAAPGPAGDALSLGGIGGRALDLTQERCADLDRRPPIRGDRVRLRWTAVPADEPPSVIFVLGGELRHLQLRGRGLDAATAAAFAEDVALHDWLLTTLIRVLDGAHIGLRPTREVVERLRPAIDELVHLWMPAARSDETGRRLWQVLEQQPGFSRQWRAGVHRVRDQLALGAVPAP
ncbi:SCO2521 family protein [Hamadaea tsunoensis]|uniref:SCO2521 family protein n=1 Tax=Hamadaea tsunoensis TaxID=53368 RepID=UPI000403A8F8|nr:SCO2521 family protein [Hamadaea tsunoensis]